MGSYFEASIGKSISGSPVEMGRKAASEALSKVKSSNPALLWPLSRLNWISLKSIMRE